MVVDFRHKLSSAHKPLNIKGVPFEMVKTFRNLRIYISADLAWLNQVQPQISEAGHQLHHLRQLRGFEVSPASLIAFYSLESILTTGITAWFGKCSALVCKALQGVERISKADLPSLQDIYLRWGRSRAARISRVTTHPHRYLFTSLRSGKRFNCLAVRTETFRRSFYPQAIRLLNTWQL